MAIHFIVSMIVASRKDGDVMIPTDDQLGPMTITYLVIMVIVVGTIAFALLMVAIAQVAVLVYIVGNRRLWIIAPFLWIAYLIVAAIVGYTMMLN